MMLPAGKDGSERLLARGYVPWPKITGLPARLGTRALRLTVAVWNGADQQLHENRTREDRRIKFDRRNIFTINDIKGMRDSNECG